MLKLEFKDRRQPGVWLVESVFSVGSGSKNNLVIDDDSVAESHAEILLDDGRLYLRDLGSFKGTSVAGQEVTDNFQLRSGDVISLGRVELEISDPKTRPVAGGHAKIKSDWSLMPIGGSIQSRSIMIHGSMTIGRSVKCDIVVDGEYMSRRHAELSFKEGGLRIVDLGSSNGTCVNGRKVNECQLKPGDKISFDKTVFLVAGPVGTNIPDAFDDEDEEEATMFRAVAPIPKAPPPPKRQSSVAPPVPQVDNNVSAAGAGGGKAGMIATIVLVVAIAAAVVGYVVVVGV
ncbi:MAG: FHA domain-containing protein [Moraxellaceae bacterium]|nr:MAG: FHA domain-containing protein [Moraxellaceae bacterium]